MKVTRRRSTKLGDYRMPTEQHKGHSISVNGDLNQYMFLMVLIHEMAHLQTFVDYGRRVQPHGRQWQENYRAMLCRYHQLGCFPSEVDGLMSKYTARIPMPRKTGSEIEFILAHYGEAPGEIKAIRLKDLPVGTEFRMVSKPQILFKSLEKRRTRYCCVDVARGMKYLVSGESVVQPQGLVQ